MKCLAELGIGGVGPGEVRNERRDHIMDRPIFYVLDVKRDVLKMLNRY